MNFDNILNLLIIVGLGYMVFRGGGCCGSHGGHKGHYGDSSGNEEEGNQTQEQGPVTPHREG